MRGRWNIYDTTAVVPLVKRCWTYKYYMPAVSRSKHNERSFVLMNQTDGWMGGWTGGGMWIWPVIGIAVVVLLVVVIINQSKK